MSRNRVESVNKDEERVENMKSFFFVLPPYSADALSTATCSLSKPLIKLTMKKREFSIFAHRCEGGIKSLMNGNFLYCWGLKKLHYIEVQLSQFVMFRMESWNRNSICDYY
jgi:hypothetical protein